MAVASLRDIVRVFAKRDVVWQYPYIYQDSYGACDLIRLNPGLIISSNPEIVSLISSKSEYHAWCSKNMILASTLNEKLRDGGLERLPVLDHRWDDFVSSEYHFLYTVYPIIYSLSCCTFICCFLALILFTKQYMRSHKPTVLIKLSTLSTGLYVLSIYIYSAIMLYKQRDYLISSGDLLIMKMQQKIAFNVVDLVVVIMLQLSQVQIIMRLFPRRREKRFTFIAGLLLSISSQTMWSIAFFLPSGERFGTDPDYDSSIAILPLFVYLLRIAMSMLYTCLFVVYFFNKRQYIFNPKVLPLTVFTFIIMNSSFAIFIADISNIWMNELSELFNVTAYVVINVVSWEFINRIILLEKFEQKKGILGRQFYDEEDQYYCDFFGNAVDQNRIVKKGKYDLIISSHDKGGSSFSRSSTNSDKNLTVKSVTNEIYETDQKNLPQSRITHRWNKFTLKLAEFTDHLVEMSPAGQMNQGSLLSNESLYDTEISKPRFLHGFVSKKLFNKEKKLEPPAPVHNHNVFIYKPKEIKIESQRKRKNPRKHNVLTNNNNNNELHATHNSPKHVPLSCAVDDDDDDDSHQDEISSNIIGNQLLNEELVFDDGSYDFDDDTSNENASN